MGNKLRYKNYKSDGPFDQFYLKLVFDEFQNDAAIQFNEMMDLFFLFKNMVFSTNTDQIKAKCTYRKCYDDTAYSADKIWVVEYDDGETPSFLCKECMANFEYAREEHQTLYHVLAKQKEEVPVMGIRGLKATVNPNMLSRVIVKEYVEAETETGYSDKKVVDWISYPNTDYAQSSICSYYRGKGLSTLDAELLAEALIERWEDEKRHFEKILDQVKSGLEEGVAKEDGVWSGTVVTSKLEEGKYCYYGKNVPDVYWWVIDKGEGDEVKVSYSYLAV